jgi:hypothetical protein
MIPTLRLGPTDVTILRAACLDGEAAVAAVAALRRDVDIDALDWGRQRLLPLLHRNLVRLGVTDWHDARLRGVRRYFWARSEVRLRALRPALAALTSAGVETLLLKGGALVAAGFEDLSARPMDDLDLLVRRARLPQAVELLAGQGFRPRGIAGAELLADVASRLPGWVFEDGAGNELDLHWHAMHADCRADADDTFWRDARPATLMDIAVRVPDPTHQMLHAIAHAVRWSETSTPRWAADAHAILRAGDGVRWDQLAAQARARRLVPAIHDGLAMLSRHLDVSVPESTMRSLRRPHPLTRFEMMLASAPPDSLRSWRPDALAVFQRRRMDAALWRSPLVATAWAMLRAEPDLPRAAALFVHRATGSRRPIRRTLRIDRWARRVAPEPLPWIGEEWAGGAGPRAFLDGWHQPEAGGRWSAAREARIGWRLPAGTTGPLLCRLSIAALTPDGLPSTKIRVFANDHLVAAWRSRRREAFAPERCFIVPAAAVRGRAALIVSFTVEELRTPKDYGMSRDRRPLGVFLREMAVSPATQQDVLAAPGLQAGRAPPI